MSESSVMGGSRPPAFAALGQEDGLDALLADCARMVPRWVRAPDPCDASEAYEDSVPVPSAAIHGVRVPAGSARMLEAMAEYGAE